MATIFIIGSYFFSFRPLSGSYISQLVTVPVGTIIIIMFPSPIGELHFSIMISVSIRKGGRQVSVPYRGATFLNSSSSMFTGNARLVSVPYRGATFLNRIVMYDRSCHVSVPYRGATFLNCNSGVDAGSFLKVSVPYRGATFLNKR